MKPAPESTSAPIGTRLESFAVRWRKPLLLCAVILMGLAGLLRMGKEIPRYLTRDDGIGANDLDLRYRGAASWMDAPDFYQHVSGNDYPPASFIMFWTAMGWLDWETAKWMWLTTMAAGLLALAWIGVRHSLLSDPLAKLCFALVLLAGYAASTTMLVGQLTIHVLLLLLLFGIRLNDGPRTRNRDLLTAALLVVALVKPSTAAPFFWLALFLPGRFRIAVLVVLGYAAVAAVAAIPRPESVGQLHIEWIQRLRTWPPDGAGYVHLHRLMIGIGLADYRVFGSLLGLALLGAWVYVHRFAGIWPLLGLTAIFSRLWIYHRVYDDLILLIPMIALCRIFQTLRLEGKSARMPAFLLVANGFFLLAPSGILRWDSHFSRAYETLIGLVWIGTALFLGAVARRQVHAVSRPVSPVAGRADRS